MQRACSVLWRERCMLHGALAHAARRSCAVACARGAPRIGLAALLACSSRSRGLADRPSSPPSRCARPSAQRQPIPGAPQPPALPAALRRRTPTRMHGAAAAPSTAAAAAAAAAATTMPTRTSATAAAAAASRRRRQSVVRSSARRRCGLLATAPFRPPLPARWRASIPCIALRRSCRFYKGAMTAPTSHGFGRPPARWRRQPPTDTSACICARTRAWHVRGCACVRACARVDAGVHACVGRACVTRYCAHEGSEIGSYCVRVPSVARSSP
jgi:hypothetical protein